MEKAYAYSCRHWHLDTDGFGEFGKLQASITWIPYQKWPWMGTYQLLNIVLCVMVKQVWLYTDRGLLHTISSHLRIADSIYIDIRMVDYGDTVMCHSMQLPYRD